MTLHEQIKGEIKAAMLAKDTVRLSVVRNMLSAFTNELVATGKTPQDQIPDADALKVVKRLANQRKDSIEQFEKGGRMDLVEKEQAELKVIEEFLPAQLSEADLDAAITEAIRETGATSARDMGKVMKVVMPKLTGRADGKAVGEKVKARLSA